jgi:hypothetical protein
MFSSVSYSAKVDNKVIAIISGRKSQSYIKEIVELLWSSRQLAWFEQISYAKNHNNIPYHAEGRPRFEGQVSCGHNPWIEAHRIHDVEAYIDEDGKEHLQGKYWRPTLKNGKSESTFAPFHIIRDTDDTIHNVDA